MLCVRFDAGRGNGMARNHEPRPMGAQALILRSSAALVLCMGGGCSSGTSGSFTAFDPASAAPDDAGAGKSVDPSDGGNTGAPGTGSAPQDAGSKPPPVASCGDGSCNGKETCSDCADDCGACPKSCGDDVCDSDETCSSCAFDCGSCTPSCGDQMCNGIETCSTCTFDCGACPPACGDGMCNGNETCADCAGDCGACPPPCGELRAERALGHGESVPSCDGRFSLIMQPDGNLVLYQGSKALWSSKTSGTAANRAVMQSDGNFVVYEPSRARWASGTDGNPGAWLAVQNDGNVVVYSAAGSPLWATGTSQ